jgi:hypothetical protein
MPMALAPFVPVLPDSQTFLDALLRLCFPVGLVGWRRADAETLLVCAGRHAGAVMAAPAIKDQPGAGLVPPPSE